MRLITAYLIGLIFGTGILISGMANPAKVLNFFDIFGTWDPSLAFVMAGALTFTTLGYRLILPRGQTLFGGGLHLPTKQDIDARLLAGSATFGLGWGIAGFCPGGALPALGTGRPEVLVFVIALSIGLVLARLIDGGWTQRMRGKTATGAAV